MVLSFFLLFYNLLFPIGLLLYVPSIVVKLVRRGGEKKNFAERLSIFSSDKKRELEKFRGAIWIHSVSVGETQIALSFIEKWRKDRPGDKFVISTTTTTAQGLALEKLSPGCALIFCPIDFFIFVRRTFSLLSPSKLLVFETELWPAMISEARKRGIPLAVLNARISDRSFPRYRRLSFFFAPLLRRISLVCAQTEEDRKRFDMIAPGLSVSASGNMKFDQTVPSDLPLRDLAPYFGDCDRKVILGASTHPGEEKMIAGIYLTLKKIRPGLKLILAPRHAERAPGISDELAAMGLSHVRRTASAQTPCTNSDCLLLDTTGELLSFMAVSDIVVMGKSFAGHDEGHNLIEPALLSKPIICGARLRNFKFVFEALRKENALIAVATAEELESALAKLAEDPSFAAELGARAFHAISIHRGATDRTMELIRNLER